MYVGDVSNNDGTVGSGPAAFAELATGWQTAFSEAWESWRAGNYGIGAALVDPSADRVVSMGRNRVAQSEREPGLLSRHMAAHAEMNAFAALGGRSNRAPPARDRR